jgi:hypothetical protein
MVKRKRMKNKNTTPIKISLFFVISVPNLSDHMGVLSERGKLPAVIPFFISC